MYSQVHKTIISKGRLSEKYFFFHLTATQKIAEDTTCFRYPDLCEISLVLCPLRKEKGFEFGNDI